ncbi:MAG: CooT family nickel-binding protein, partial [Methanosarcinaceae archaeon]
IWGLSQVILLQNSSGKGGMNMCELNAILVHDGKREQIMESVTRMIVDGDFIELTGIFGEKQIVPGSIIEVNFSKGETIILGK